MGGNIKAIVINEKDNVATALKPLNAGIEVSVERIIRMVGREPLHLADVVSERTERIRRVLRGPLGGLALRPIQQYPVLRFSLCNRLIISVGCLLAAHFCVPRFWYQV